MPAHARRARRSAGIRVMPPAPGHVGLHDVDAAVVASAARSPSSVDSSSPAAIGVVDRVGERGVVRVLVGRERLLDPVGRYSSIRRTRAIASSASDQPMPTSIISSKSSPPASRAAATSATSSSASRPSGPQPSLTARKPAPALLRDDARRLGRRVRHQRARIGLDALAAARRRAARGSACRRPGPAMSHSAMSIPLIACIDDAAAAEVDRAAVHPLPQPLDVERVLADEQRAQAVRDLVRRPAPR